MHLVIRNEEDLQAALDRSQELMGCANGSDEEREFADIADAVEAYTRRRDQAANEKGRPAPKD